MPAFAVALYAVAYVTRVRTLQRRGHDVSAWRQMAFGGGLAIVLTSQLPPLDDFAERSLPAHMAQHLLLADVASFLLVVGVTGPILAPVLRLRPVRALRPLTHPVVALVTWAVILYAWHVPALYEMALRSPLVHALEHASFLWGGVLLWAALLGPLPKPSWFGTWARLVYVVAVRFVGALLANVLIWSGTLLYPSYAAEGRATALHGQVDAGAMMMIEGMLASILLLGWLFFRLADEDERRQRLLDAAAAHGVALSPARAARAAAAGSTDRLADRLLTESASPAAVEQGRVLDRH